MQMITQHIIIVVSFILLCMRDTYNIIFGYTIPLAVTHLLASMRGTNLDDRDSESGELTGLRFIRIMQGLRSRAT